MFTPWLLLVTSLLLMDGIPGLEEPPDILEERCCDRKSVGGVTYTLLSINKMKTKTCESRCLYQKDNHPGKTFSFAKGALALTCPLHPNSPVTLDLRGTDLCTSVEEHHPYFW